MRSAKDILRPAIDSWLASSRNIDTLRFSMADCVEEAKTEAYIAGLKKAMEIAMEVSPDGTCYEGPSCVGDDIAQAITQEIRRSKSDA